MTEPEQPVVAVPLRAALLRVLLDEGLLRPGNEGDAEGGRLMNDYNGLVVDELARAALAVEAVRPETIDEERLARALADHYGPRLNFPGSFGSDARAIIAAYHRPPR